MKVSRFGQKIKRGSGISQLMVDMGEGLAAGKDVLMLGGGNPAHIPEVDEAFRQRMTGLLAKKRAFERAVGDYDPPQGNKEFIEAISGLLQSECGWNISPANVALTTGSQSAFFILFNIFAGGYEDGSIKKILLPLAPEYIGYCDVGFADPGAPGFVGHSLTTYLSPARQVSGRRCVFVCPAAPYTHISR